MKSVRWPEGLLSAACLSFCLSLSGCSAVGYGSKLGRATGGAPAGSVTLHVSNDHAEDVRVYLLRGSTRIPVGTVGSFSVRRFVIPSAQVGSSGVLQLIAEALASRAMAAPEALDIEPGDEVDFQVENNLKFSRLMIRVYRPQ